MVEMFAQDILGACVRALLPSPQASGYLPAILPQPQAQRAIITADELLITAFGWLAGAFNKKVLFETALFESLGETTVLMNRQHSSRQTFFDLFGELNFFIVKSMVILFSVPRS